MTRPVLTLKGVKLSQPFRDLIASQAAQERAFVNAIDRARKKGKQVKVRVVYPEPRRSVR